ncbi:MAG: hypothetical protein HKN41_02110 [Ilumatobacter sp.]|nr:hypothetical protein [Ilumatobacter sp.]
MSARIDISVFGPTRAEVDGRPVDLGGARIRSLLAALVAARPRGASTELLIETVWSGSAPATARKSVQKYVSDLRRSLSDDVIVTTSDGYRLGEASVDIDRVRMLADDGDRHRADGEPEAALDAYRSASDLVAGGAPLADIAESESVEPITAALAEVIAAVEEHAIEVLIELGELSRAVAEAERLVAEQPLRESAWALLMTALYRSNRQTDALRAYRRVQVILAEELGIEPSSELRELEARILRHDLDRVDAAPVGGESVTARGGDELPLAYTSFVGREREITELAELQAASRLITITGPGGSGKTRLAVEAAAALATDRSSTFVDLAQIEDPANVETSFAIALGIAPEAGVAITSAMTVRLQGRATLLVVDNCEHVRGAAAALIHLLLSSVGDLSVIATSREPLGLTGEVVYALHPLPIPPASTAPAAPVDEVAGYAAIELFVDRARAAAPGFSLDETVGSVVSICRRLDGIPLAIELAARQLAVLDLADVERSLADGLDHLAVPGEPVPRHRTLAAAIEWSYRMLDEDVQAFHEAITAFPGSFTRAAAERIWELVGGSGDASERLDRLVAHSMVLRLPSPGGSRYRLLEPIREFGAARAADRYPPGVLGRAHATWVHELLSEDPTIFGPNERDTLRRVRAEDHHLSVALAWAIANDAELALRVTIASTSYISMASYRFTWFDELQAAIDVGRQAPPDLRARALAHAGFSLAENFADHEISTRYANEALEYATTHADVELQVVATLTLASARRNAGQLDAAVALHEEAIALADSIDAPVWAIRARRWLAFTEMQRAHYRRALEMIGSAREVGEAIGSDWVSAKTLWLTAAVLALEGEYEQAEVAAARSFVLFDGYDDQASPLHVRAVQGDAARLAGDFERATSIYAECLRGFRNVGDRRCAASTLRNVGLSQVHLGRVDEAREHLLDALAKRLEFGDDAGVAECLEALALAAAAAGDAEAALTLGAAGDELRERSGSRPPAPERDDLDRAAQDAERSTHPDRAQRAIADGRTLAGETNMVEAVTELLDRVD